MNVTRARACARNIIQQRQKGSIYKTATKSRSSINDDNNNNNSTARTRQRRKKKKEQK